MKEILEHAKKNPLKFGGGLLSAGAGIGAVGYGAYKASDMFRSKKREEEK